MGDKRIFGLIKEGNGKLRIGIFLAQKEGLCPISKSCNTLEELGEEIDRIYVQLQDLLKEAESFFKLPSKPFHKELSPDMSAEQVWEVLSNIDSEEDFIKMFNGLNEEKRREVADFVFSKCNIFSGKASIFSLRYNSESALLE